MSELRSRPPADGWRGDARAMVLITFDFDAEAPILAEGEHYAAISRETGASTATITRIASWYRHGEGGYRRALERLDEARTAGTPYSAGRER